MTNKLIEFYYKWNRFEKQNNVSIIDLDLLQKGDLHPGTFNNRNEVKGELENLIKIYNQDSKKEEIIQKKLIASQYFLRALLGEEIPFREYVSNTMGFNPIIVPETILRESLDLLKNSYEAIGYKWEKKSIAEYKKQNRVDIDEIKKTFNDFKDKIVPEVLNWLGLKITLDYKTQFVDLDEYWMNWISTNQDGEILLKYNLNKRHQWVRGSTEFLVFHEICSHAVQVSMWKEQIEKGVINPFLGLTTIFTPEQFILEGIAESLLHFYPQNPYSQNGLISQYEDSLYWLVWNNIHVKANEGEDIESIIKYINSYLPHLSREEIIRNIKEKTSDPLGRTYQYIYGSALYYHMQIAKQLNNEEKKSYVRGLFTKISYPDSILKKFNLV